MDYLLIVVEGPHDAAFVGALLRERGFRRTQLRAHVDPFWTPLIPTQFPSNPEGRLDHVVKFPDFYTNGAAQSVAVAAAGGYDKLVVELQASLDALGSSRLLGIAIIADADDIEPEDRLADVLAKLDEVNKQGTANGVDGFPLTLPTGFAIQDGPGPRIGLYILPDGIRIGTLETLLLECATVSYSSYHRPTVNFVDAIAASQPPESADLRHLRKGSGMQKATANIIGNLLNPGCSLSTAIERGRWLEGVPDEELAIGGARRFLDAILHSVS